MSSRQAQCSTSIPSATRQMWMNVHAAGRPVTGSVGQQRHRGGPVGAVQRHVLDDEVALADEVVLLEAGRPEVDLDGAQDRPQPLAALGAGGVVDHVGGHEVVQDRVVARPLPPEQLLDHVPGAARVGTRSSAPAPDPPGRRASCRRDARSGHWTSSMR